jgi:DNA polymerase I-like protein with 3'-5' exonuclease and polymerase domains
MRHLIKPQSGMALAYIDWEQQEFGIGAALSGDAAMQEAYASGDPYLEFAKQAGAVPQSATRATHSRERDQFKACVLATQYGLGAESLAQRIDVPVAEARHLLFLHRTTYPTFWRWSDDAVDEAAMSGRLWTCYGWQIDTRTQLNDRSLRNFPMQAHGAEMLRLGCILMTEAGLRVCAPVHDAVLLEAPIAGVGESVQLAREKMAEASRHVLGGFELRTDAGVVRHPDQLGPGKGKAMLDTVIKLLEEIEAAPEVLQ